MINKIISILASQLNNISEETNSSLIFNIIEQITALQYCHYWT